MREGLQKIVSLHETIAAISTPLGRSALGVIRLSGPKARSITSSLFHSASELQPRYASVGTWADRAGEVIDQVVATFWKAPQSYTGEDVVEISAHGNPMVLKRILRSIIDCGARLATPGEFTLRAVVNGKMDLTQAEAVGEFIEAQTEEQGRTALRQLRGSSARRLAPLKAQLVELIAYLEAGIDFAEDDVDVLAGGVVAGRLQEVVGAIDTILQTFSFGRILIDGLRVTIVGKPNVGKSSLFNRLLSLDRAIVTEVPGTTRDILREVLDLDGVPLRLIDTAGLRETGDLVEQVGVARSLEAVAESDLTIVVLDGSREFSAEDGLVLQKTADSARLVVINKCDLPELLPPEIHELAPLRISAKCGEGLDSLREAIGRFFLQRRTDAADDFVLTTVRQNEGLSRARGSLKAAHAAVLAGVPHEMILLDAYEALSALGELTGEVVTEDILDRIFSSFCIGK